MSSNIKYNISAEQNEPNSTIYVRCSSKTDFLDQISKIDDLNKMNSILRFAYERSDENNLYHDTSNQIDFSHNNEHSLSNNRRKYNVLEKDTGTVFNSPIKCRIVISGKSTIGESIFFSIEHNNSPIYSCVIDSFISTKSTLGISDALKKYTVSNKLNSVVWTHPHDDHSNGLIQIIKEYKPAKIYIPCNLNLKRHSANTQNDLLNLTTHSSPSRKVWNKLISISNKTCKDNLDSVVEPVFSGQILDSGTFYLNSHPCQYKLKAFSPSSAQSFITSSFYTQQEKQDHMINNYSVGIILEIGDFCAFFASDLENESINECKTTYPQQNHNEILYPNFLKVPHHGSSRSTDILNLYSTPEKINLCVSTAFSTKGLPDAIEQYNEKSEFVYKITPASNPPELATFDIEVDIEKAEIKINNNTNYQVVP